jgi:hypothetical protein
MLLVTARCGSSNAAWADLIVSEYPAVEQVSIPVNAADVELLLSSIFLELSGTL